MARNIAKLVEALKIDENSNKFWWDILGSIGEARKIVLSAFKEKPTEGELQFLIELLDIKERDKIQSYKRCLEELRKELIQIEN